MCFSSPTAPLDKVPAISTAPAAEIEEPAARQMLSSLRRVAVDVPGLGAVTTAVAGPSEAQLAAFSADAPAIVLLHGFDSSLLEYRRLWPLLLPHCPTYAIDLLGWGFTDSSRFSADPKLVVGPAAKRAHLAAFLEQQELAGRRVVLVGASLGGAAALDFALEHPQRASQLVLIDAQAFIDGIGPGAGMPRWAAQMGVQVLRSVWLRSMAGQMSYFDAKRLSTTDAMRVARLHTFMPGWQDAIVSFMNSGGYSGIGKRVPEVDVPALVLWGRQDGILPTAGATLLSQALPQGSLTWVEECGHVPHLEQPQLAAQHILEFVAAGKTAAPAAVAAAR